MGPIDVSFCSHLARIKFRAFVKKVGAAVVGGEDAGAGSGNDPHGDRRCRPRNSAAVPPLEFRPGLAPSRPGSRHPNESVFSGTVNFTMGATEGE